MIHMTLHKRKNIIVLILLAAIMITLETGNIQISARADSNKLKNNKSSVYGIIDADVLKYEGTHREKLSGGAENIIKRARQLSEIKWTCLKDIESYPGGGDGLVFRKGVEYTGVPYGQPVHSGKYIGFACSIDDFAAAASDIESAMYTLRGENTWNYTSEGGDILYCPYFSSDCSAFISYVWDLPERYTTYRIASETRKKGEKGYSDADFLYVGRKLSDLKVGYALNKSSSHIILVYDIIYDSHGKLLQVTTLEQTPPFMRLRVWGAGGNAGSLNDLQRKISNAPYDIIRYKNMDNVKFEESEYIKLDSENLINRMFFPISAQASGFSDGSGAVVKGSAVLEEGAFELSGLTYCADGVSSVLLCADGGSWSEADIIKYQGAVRFSQKLSLDTGKHSIKIKGISASQGYEYLIADFDVAVGKKSDDYDYVVYFDNINGTATDSYKNAPVKLKFSFKSPLEGSLSFNGWGVCKAGIRRFEYRIDDGMWIPVETGFRNDVYKSMKKYQEECSAFNSFSGGFGTSDFKGNSSYTVYIRGVNDENGVFEVAEINISIGRETYKIGGIYVDKFTMILIISIIAAVLILSAAVAVLILIRKNKNKDKGI